jgi:Domain of unknown function (DUF4440)
VSRTPSATRLLPLVFALACTPPANRAIARMTAESEVRQAQRQRFDAMIRQDVAALDTLLDDELDYVHTGGDLQSRPEFIDMIKKQALVYESIAPSEVKVRVYDGLALAMGRSQMRVRNAEGISSFEIRFTEVYVRRDAHWLLTAWEATKLPARSAGERSRAGLASTRPKRGALSFAANRLEILYRRHARRLQTSVR